MEQYKNVTVNRTQKVIFFDKLSSPANFKQAIKLEIFGALSQFMNISQEDVKLKITICENGKYRFDFSVETSKVNSIGIIAK